MENNESKWTTIKVDSMYRLIDPSGDFVASASKLNCDGIASTLNNYQALKEENESLTTQLAKANSDKEKLGELLKEVYESQIANCELCKEYGLTVTASLHQENADRIKLLLTDCGITL